MMSNAARSPKSNQRSGRSRLSSFLKSSTPPEPRKVSLKVAALKESIRTTATDSASPNWPLGPNTLSPTSSHPTPKDSKEGGIEVVIETASRPGTAYTNGSGHNESPQRRLTKQVTSKGAPVPISTESFPAIAEQPRREKANGYMRDNPPRGVVHRSASDIFTPENPRPPSSYSGNLNGGIPRALSENGLSSMASLEKPPAAVPHTQKTEISQRRSVTQRLRSRSRPRQITAELPEEGLAELPKALLSPKEEMRPDPSDDRSTFARFARRTSWIVGSRSPSPSNRKLTASAPEKHLATHISQSPAAPPNVTSGLATPLKEQTSFQQRVNTSTAKKARRPLSAILSRSNSFVGSRPSNPSALPRSYSAERLPTSSVDEVPEVPEMPKTIPRSGSRTPVTEPQMRKKDELWGNFRTLDAEYQK